MHTWSWQTWNESTYLTCSLLERWPHGFFSRQAYPQPPQDLVVAIHPQAQVFRVKQVHGNRVLSPTDVKRYWAEQATLTPQSEIMFPDADGLRSDGPNQAIWVCSADCTPVLIADERMGSVAAVHAGWRGTAARIVPEAIAQMLAQGSHTEDLRVAMGPAIAGEVYQVSMEVAAKVGRSILDDEVTLVDADSVEEAICKTLMELPISPVFADEKEGHVRLDVRCVNALQLDALGLTLDQIAIAPHCTYQDPERFFSYRRDGLKQVQWSGVVSIPM
jgi:polyphenol oxidase